MSPSARFEPGFELPWPGYVAAIDCWLCDGLFDPPCPFHPNATPASVLADGLWRYATTLHWQQAAHNRADA